MVKYMLYIIPALAMLASCKQTEYVQVPEVHEHWHHQTDTIRQTDSIIDSHTLIVREVDSATMAKMGLQMQGMQRAWLIESNRLRQEIKELRQSKSDTVTIRDSIPYPVEVIKEVPASLTWWQQIRLHIANTALYVLALLFFILIIRYKIGRF